MFSKLKFFVTLFAAFPCLFSLQCCGCSFVNRLDTHQNVANLLREQLAKLPVTKRGPALKLEICRNSAGAKYEDILKSMTGHVVNSGHYSPHFIPKFSPPGHKSTFNLTNITQTTATEVTK